VLTASRQQRRGEGDARREREEKPGTPQAACARRELRGDDDATLLAIPAEKADVDNPEWVKFLLYDTRVMSARRCGRSSLTTATRRSRAPEGLTSRSTTRASPRSA